MTSPANNEVLMAAADANDSACIPSTSSTGPVRLPVANKARECDVSKGRKGQPLRRGDGSA